MFKDLPMRIFLIHLVAFIASVLICAGINIWLTPGRLWFPWVLIGWGVLVATHAFALLLRKTRRRERIFIDKKARASIVHLFAYVAVVLMLLFVNAAVTPKVWWFYWVALGWGIGVAIHLWCAFGKRRKRPRAAARPASQQAATPHVTRSATQTELQPPLQPDQPTRKRAPRQKKPKA